MTKVVVLLAAVAQVCLAAPRVIALDKAAEIELRGLKSANVEYRGRAALKLSQAGAQDNALAILKGVTFKDGTIEVEVSGGLAPEAGAAARGFVGVAFRVGPDAKQFEYIYLRPTNGRADDQVRRNHSVQYASHPDYPWPRLRKEEPEKYETYVDLEPNVWTKMRIVISGTKARLYVHGSAQPVLVVNDLKLGAGEGGVALWVGPGTEAHFANLTITPAE
ncbi:MAG TPA: hypothetical protein VER03_12275 [Bryobacteraceae bacterium]|nr:hypothetical protein [Bryobacteraceae bacterium]